MKRRLAIAGVVTALVAVAVGFISLGYVDVRPESSRIGASRCVREPSVTLVAQSVPSAQLVPCLTDEAAGWSVDTTKISNEGTDMTLSTSKVNGVSWTLAFAATCADVDAGAPSREIAPEGQPAVVSTRTVDLSGDEGIERTQWFRFDGGCVTSTVVVPGRLDRQIILAEVDRLLALVTRRTISAEVRVDTDGKLSLDPTSTRP